MLLRSRALLVPGNRFEFLEATAAKEAVDEGQRDGEDFRPGGLDVLAQQPEPMALKDISERTGLHPSTEHRILNDVLFTSRHPAACSTSD